MGTGENGFGNGFMACVVVVTGKERFVELSPAQASFDKWDGEGAV